VFEAPVFNGLQNYINLFLSDDVFLIAVKNTFLIDAITGPDRLSGVLPVRLAYQRAAAQNSLDRRGDFLCAYHFRSGVSDLGPSCSPATPTAM
jgi:hypothetical protein